MITRALEFLAEVKAEVNKVTWPSRREALSGTAVVLVVVLLMATFLGIIDAILSRIVQSII